MNLEDLLRKSAKSGRLNHLSLAFTRGKWEAHYRGVDDSDKRIAAHQDPACALIEAITGRKAEIAITGRKAEIAITGRKAEVPVPAKTAKPEAPKDYDPLDDI